MIYIYICEAFTTENCDKLSCLRAIKYSQNLSVRSNILKWCLEEKDSDSPFFQLLIGNQLIQYILISL